MVILSIKCVYCGELCCSGIGFLFNLYMLLVLRVVMSFVEYLLCGFGVCKVFYSYKLK